MLFKDIQGQDQAVAYLTRCVAQARVPHALLFTGPEGVGKRATALALAQALNCQASREGEACGVCSACRKVERGAHADVRLLEPEGQSLKIDQIREHLQRGVMLKAMEGRTKVYLLDPADALTPEAANSLLKVLEEPPADVVIVLITTQPFGLFPTIRSRCQEVRFHALSMPAMTAWLENRQALAPEMAKTLARLSGGRPAEALRLADPEVQALRAQAIEIVRQASPGEWPAAALRLGELQAELPEVLTFILTWYRDQLILVSGGDRELLMNRDRLSDLAADSRRETPETLQEKCRAVLKAQEQIRRNVNIQLVLENVFMQLGSSRTGTIGTGRV